MSPRAQPKWIVLTSAGLLLGGGRLAAGSLRTQQQASALPRMSCDQLIRKGRAAPQFVTLSDVHLCQNGCAFRRDMDAAMEMVVPIYSNRLKEEPRPAELVLLLEILDDRQRERLVEQPAVGELTVELRKDAPSLDPWVGNRLATIYPGIQLVNCRVLSVGLHEPSAFRARHEWRDGVAMLLLAAACQLGWWIRRGVNKSRAPEAVALLAD